MRITCNSLNSPHNNIAVWVAIYTSILFTAPNHSSAHHHPVAASIAALAVILLAAVVARIYCGSREAA
jgi:hypothetical protein